MYPVVRNKGHFGEVSVFWVLDPPLPGDVSPLQGNITFGEGEHLKNITLFSVPDEVGIKLIIHPSGQLFFFLALFKFELIISDRSQRISRISLF